MARLSIVLPTCNRLAAVGVAGTALALNVAMAEAGGRAAVEAPLDVGTLALWRQLLARPASPPLAETRPAAPAPDQNQSGAMRARRRLGEALFHDRRLSRDTDRTCASCHKPARAFTDGHARAAARGGGHLARNTPTLMNIGWSRRLNWDGATPTLEAQALRPLTHLKEMAGDLAETAARLERDPRRRRAFAAAFPSPSDGSVSRIVTTERIVSALAAYQRTLVSPLTRFDRWIEGDTAALTATELRGFAIFIGKGRCATCHAGWRFTDDTPHDIGLPLGGNVAAADAPGHRTAFKTPTLRELTRTAPYMHDGSLASLDAVVRHYAGGLVQRPSLAPNINPNLRLTPRERRQLVAFLRTLSPPPDRARRKRWPRSQ